MGATCSPGEAKNDIEVRENIDFAQSDTAGQFIKIINDYRTKNEKLNFELNSLKDLNDVTVAEHEEKTRKNEEVMRELGDMKALLDAKNRALVRGRLEAALLSKATSMLAVESKTKLCIKGELLHHYKRRSKKRKYVEVYVSLGEVTNYDFNAGYVMLTFSDRRDAKISNRCQVLEVIMDKSNSKEHTFTIKALVEGIMRNVTFSCESAEQRDDWVKSTMDALTEVKAVFDDMHSLFTLKIEFTKETMGFSVEENLIDYDEADEKEQKSEQFVTDSGKRSSKDLIKMESARKAAESGKQVAEDVKESVGEVADSDKLNSNDDKKEDVEAKKPERPCELVVSKITDDDLIAAGLQVNCIVREINGFIMSGMVYSKQLEILMTTTKPYILTFTGQKFLKHKPEAKHGYFSILKELVADGDNSVKMAFSDLVAGTAFEMELGKSTDKKATIQRLLSNQRQLIALLTNFTVQQMDL